MEGHRHPGRIFAGYHRRAGRLWVGRQPDAAPGDAGQDERAIRGGGHADPGPATTASPAATPAPSAISYGPVTSVAGTSDCQIGTGTMTTGTDGVEHYREARSTASTRLTIHARAGPSRLRGMSSGGGPTGTPARTSSGAPQSW